MAFRPAGMARARMMPVFNALAGLAVAGLLRLVRLIPHRALTRLSIAAMRWIGPKRHEHKTGRDNLVAAFPEKTPQEIDKILMGAWENLGHFVADFAHLDRLTFQDDVTGVAGDVIYTEAAVQRFHQLKDSKQPLLLFSAHLSNWELPALIPARFGQPSAVLYRPPNIAAAAEAALRVRGATMGTLIASGYDAPIKIAQALREGQWVGMLVDQYKGNGAPVTFFGRRTVANPTIARIARQTETAIYGVRARRLDDGRYQIEPTDPLIPPRDAEGKIDVNATMQAIFDVIEGWIRETPEQWLWLHRRWR